MRWSPSVRDVSGDSDGYRLFLRTLTFKWISTPAVRSRGHPLLKGMGFHKSYRFRRFNYPPALSVECSMTDDLPAELERVPHNPDMANVLQNVFEGASLIAIHPEKALIAVWYGGTGFNVYDPNAWPVTAEGEQNTGEVYHFNSTDPSRLDDPRQNARETFEEYGFKVVGE